MKTTSIFFLLILSTQLPAQEYFQNNIKSHSIEDKYLIKAIRQLISSESLMDQDFQNGRGYILVKKKLASDSSWYHYEITAQYAAIDIENDVLFPEYYAYVDKRMVMFFLDESAHFRYKSGEKAAFLKKLEKYLAPKEPVKKMVNGKMMKDKDFRPENKYATNPKKVTLQYRHNDLPLILSEYL
ncbi:MAG: hypothetical protein Roseis2KO_35690 [Roseivirga sp.]